ncbi:MAG: hypothetical protein ACT4OT_11345 [Acidobacteriota bacterium]
MARPSSVVIWIALSVILLAAATAKINAIRSDTSAASAGTSSTAPLPVSVEPTQSNRSQKIEVELVTIQRTGFDPQEIKRPVGPFTLHVNNRSEILELQFRLDRERGERLHAESPQRGKLDWKKTIDLPPGRYVLSEAQHPEWTCLITITPR